MRRNNTRKACAIIVMAAVLVLAMCSTSVFADEETGGSGTVAVQITVGEHGSVNAHTEDYTETVTEGANLEMVCKADEGFVIGSVLVNETELEAEDLQDIAGKNEGTLTLEELTEDLTVAVNFTEEGTPAGTGTEDEGTDPQDGGEDPADSDGVADPGVTGGDDESGAAGDEGSADGTGTDTNPELAGGEEPEPAAADDGADNPADAETADPDAETADPSDTENPDTKSGNGKEGTEGSMPTYTQYNDSTPKTGDDFPIPVIVLLLVSLGSIGTLVGRYIWKAHAAASM